MANFNIIEGGQPTFMEKYPEFLKLYFQKDIMKGDIPEMLGWSKKQYRNARRKAVMDGIIKNPNPKYYHWRTDQQAWIVSRKNRLYITCNSEDEAKEMVEYLKENGWTRENAEDFKKRWNDDNR